LEIIELELSLAFPQFVTTSNTLILFDIVKLNSNNPYFITLYLSIWKISSRTYMHY